ncbi:clathrin-coated vesicle protein [Rickenella mellea]|uniref:Clathrin-coated vesicle protein n=1 Tax=Rickenella mellea TaxID=50990 RepID=A0A4Y7PLM0_9AGAM|nr:clathrin-coated vesicle protein [Rickenella mellea]
MSETNFEFDESRISGDEGEIYLLQWLSSTEKELLSSSVEVLKASQNSLEERLLKVITAPEPYPTPGRPLRELVARCLVVLYTRGETKTMFDTLQAFLKITGEFKVYDRDINKVAAFYCVGELMTAFGAQVMSFMSEIASTALKTLRSSSSSVLLRFHSLVTLKKSLTTAGRAVTDQVMKDILKQTKSSLSDKSLPVQRAAADVLITSYPADDGNRSVLDVESIVWLCTKSLDGADQETRRSLARLVGHILASTQTQRAPPPVDTSKKGKKDQKEEDDDVMSPSAAASDSAKKIMTPSEMLSQLSAQFAKPNVSRKTRIGIFDFYASLLVTLGSGFVEANYAIIIRHFFTEIISNTRNQSNRYEVLLLRKLVGILIRDLIGVRLLSEQGQIGAIQELSNSYLKRWPALMPGQTAPNASVLVIALKEVAGLLQQLGNAPPPVQDVLAEPLVTLLAHPNHSTRVGTAWALRCFCFSTPLRLPKIILNVMEMLQRDMSSLSTPTAPSDINLRAVGHAYGLGALFAVIPERPLYVSYDISAKVLDMAIQLLKRAGEHDIQVAGVEVEVAWTSIASLMALGPNFVRAHLPQLLVLWRNALPKPTSKDTSAGTGRSSAEWMFLLHVRESALGAILCFLRHNSPTLVTLDVARRISSLLSNALLFANAFVSQHVDEHQDQQFQPTPKGITITAREALLRRRVYQCFSALGFSSLTDSMQTTLLQSAVSLFASPEGYAGSSVYASIATSSGTFTSIWQTADGYGYGVTSIHCADEEEPGAAAETAREKRDRLNRDTIEVSIDDTMSQPVIGSCEHDPLLLCQTKSFAADITWPEPPPPATAVVDAAIELFSVLLPIQSQASCSRIMNELVQSVKSPKLEKNSGRKAAIFVNASIALALTLENAMTNHFRQSRETMGSPLVSSTLAAFLKDVVIDGDPVLRTAGSQALGRLASLSDTNFLTGQIKTLVDQVVNNRDPYGRAGCALAFGSIYKHVGGLAAGPLLKTTVNILMSLANDPHPVVHFWALTALTQVVNAASLAYAPFVSSTLGMLCKIYLLESHEPEGGTVNNVNIKGNLPVYQVTCQLIDAVITVLGPDIQDSSRTRNLILDLVHEFLLEQDEGICVEAIKCIQHFLMFAPEHVNISDLVTQLRIHLSSSRRPLKLAAINVFYQLVQRDAFAMSKLGGDRLVEDLFGMLDGDSSIDGVRNVITSWLQQTVVHNPSAWIDLCQRIMSRTTASQQASDSVHKNAALADDEGESLSVGMTQDQALPGKGNATSRWRTQLFALQCLHLICTLVARSGRREHLDIPFARRQGLAQSALLVSRVPDLIKMAFTASAAYVTEIRLEGLTVLRDVIEVFAKSPDADYEDALLLEQHQAPITAALTPAFSSDSTPEILSSAIQVCAVFVGCGVVKDISRMGRILKLLTSALEQSKGSEMLSLGDAGELSPNASVMLRISTLSAWAELEVASPLQTYLSEVVKPYRATLATLWVASLRDYASIRADTEVLLESGSASMESPYAGLGREVLLPYYTQAWPIIMQAVATAMKANDPNILAAMDGQETVDTSTQSDKASLRQEPTAMFFALFGLVFEALASSSADSTSTIALRQNAVTALETLKSLVKPEYSGAALLDPVIFDEFTSLCYRMAMTESAAVQVHLAEAVASFSSSQKERLLPPSTSPSDTLPAQVPLTHCLRICAYILQHAISRRDGSRTDSNATSADRIQLVRTGFTAFAIVADAFGPKLKEQTRAVAVSLYAELLKDEKSDIDLAGPTLQSLKALLENPPKPDQQSAVSQYTRMVHGLLSASLLNIDEMRGRSGPMITTKVTNNLLAAALILTVVPPSFGCSRAVIEHYCFLISSKFSESKEMSLTAAHCAKTLIAAGSSGNPLLQHCIKLLLPGMIEYIASVASMADNPASQEGHASAVDEVIKAFYTFFSSVAEPLRPRVLGVLLPAVVLLLDPSKSPPTPIHAQAITHVLAFATSAPAAFKEATGKMDQMPREVLESSVRQALGGKANTPSLPVAKPQISLRTF